MTNFTDFKNVLASKTIWGAIIMAAPTIAGLFGLDVSADDAAQAGDLVQAIITAVGGLIVLYGRATATKRLSLGL